MDRDRSTSNPETFPDEVVEFLIQILAELIIQLIFEGLFDAAVRKQFSAGSGFRRFAIFMLFGAISGLLSLLLFRHHLVTNTSLRYLALLVLPVLIGLLMAKVGRIRRRRSGDDYSLEHFTASWGFAFAFGLMRTAFAL